MGFKAEHKSYKGYESNEFYVSDLPNGFSSALQGFLIRQCEDERELKAVINDIASRIPTEPTTNWGWSFLLEDLPSYVGSLCKKDFPKIMDFLADACSKNSLLFSVDDLNEFLEDLEIGYILEFDNWSKSSSWVLRDNVDSRVEEVEDAEKYVKGICEQALDHLKQAKEHLLNTENDRDRKDAVRDCMSAMESMLKNLSGEKDIKSATQKLRTEKNWGMDVIVKDGLSIWDRVHDLYPDIRHGNPKKSDITDEEALYWLERITCFIRYMSRVYSR
ncbi:hypothetical protein [Cellvibrio sp. UBA7671]|uniref:hypothetical protein n=1 Tax=Cellvibrio sp. UBA7671 TaxID=1946312 RepID=UPI002F3584FA